MIPVALAAAALFSAPEIPKDRGYAVQEIRDGLYWITDGAYNTMLLVHETGLIAIDPLPTLGPRYLDAIASVTKKPITHVIYSHEHTDHIGAAHLFPRAEDVQGYVEAHRQALAYDFDVLVAGHVNRLGSRRDVEVSAEFAEDLRKVAAEELRRLDFPTYVRSYPVADKWDLHNEYEKALVARCTARLLPRWKDRLIDGATYLPDNCWTMIEALIVSLPERS